jgi:hypothetical protein
VGLKPLNIWFIGDLLSSHSTFLSSIINYILIFKCHLDFIATNFVFFLTIVNISILCFYEGVPYMKFQDSSRYGKIQKQVAQCIGKIC